MFPFEEVIQQAEPRAASAIFGTVVDELLVPKAGRFSGEAYVVLGAPMQVDFALQKNCQNMGRRYIEVFRSTKQDYYMAVAAEVAEPKEDDDFLMPPQFKPGSDKDHLEHTGVLKLRGLPFSASKRDIIDFFRDFNLANENVHIVVHDDGRATGEAYVAFAGPSDSKAAMCKDKMMLGSRHVELFPSSREEATRAATKSLQMMTNTYVLQLLLLLTKQPTKARHPPPRSHALPYL